MVPGDHTGALDEPPHTATRFVEYGDVRIVRLWVASHPLSPTRRRTVVSKLNEARKSKPATSPPGR
jgi:hypothetical protein